MFSRDHQFSFRSSCIRVAEWSPKTPRATLVFVHGRLGHSAIWTPLVAQLSNQFRCLLVDLPGYGGSFSVADSDLSIFDHAGMLIRLTERFSPEERVVLIGHDVGGAVAEISVLERPELYSGVVLINSASLGHEILALGIGFHGILLRRQLRLILRQAEHLDTDLEQEILSSWGSPILRVSMVRALRSMEESFPEPDDQVIYRSLLKNVPHPILLLWGGRDRINSSQRASDLMRNFKNAFFFTKDCGHCPFLEDPDWSGLKIREFVFRLQKEAMGLRTAG